MDELISALQILRKYGNPSYPTHCEHDVLTVLIEYASVSEEDKVLLKEKGFTENENGFFKSFRYGSA
jgi:hypothetical protein